MSRPVINIDSLKYEALGKGADFAAERAPVAEHIGARKLGYAVIRLAPGKRAWPYHAHRAVEEMFFILSGEGTLRHAGNEYPIRSGDFVCSPADPDAPHQIVNTSEAELTYIALSNQPETDVIHYPESGKVGIWHGDASRRRDPANYMRLFREEDAVDYWDGETDD